MGKEREQRAVAWENTHQISQCQPRPVWDHNFSIQLEVKPGSNFIDFFPGFMAVFLSTNSKCRPSLTLDGISV